VQVDLVGAALERQFGHGDQVVLVAVDATVRQQAHDVHGLAGGDCFIYRRAEGRVLEELAIADRFGDTGEVLIDHSSGAEIHVADFRVAHLAIRQAHVHARTGDQAVGLAGGQTVQYGLVGRVHGVVVVAFTVSEAIENYQDQGFRRSSHRSSRGGNKEGN